MNFKQKDLVILAYPFRDIKKRKIRPALIISNNKINEKSRDMILVPLTSITKKFPHSILINQSNLSSGMLIKESRIRIDKIFSLDKKLILKRIGSLNEKTFNKVKIEFNKLI